MISKQVADLREYADERKGELANLINRAADTIEALSTERTGEWIACTKEGLPLTELMRREGKKWYGYRCTNCGFIYKGNALTKSRYCQGCGAKMGGDTE